MAVTRNLVVFALLAGCFIKPNRVDPGGDDDGSGFLDARGDTTPPDPEFVPRVIANAFYSDVNATPMNTYGHYYLAVPASSIHEGDLLVIIGNVDNNPQWHVPDTSWQQERSVFFGHDGQTFVVFTKVATVNELDHYEGNLDNLMSGAFTVTLLAIAKANTGASGISVQHRVDPMCGSAGGCGENPVTNLADPVTTTVPNTMVIFASGVDWFDQNGMVTITQPSGYTTLASFGDKDAQDFWWTDQLVAYTIYGAPQTTPMLMGTTLSTGINGQSWALTIAIQPAP